MSPNSLELTQELVEAQLGVVERIMRFYADRFIHDQNEGGKSLWRKP
jgi:hypothetical protein